jgi:hypothetical protein
VRISLQQSGRYLLAGWFLLEVAEIAEVFVKLT